MLKAQNIIFAPALLGTIFLTLMCLASGVHILPEAPVVAATLFAIGLIWLIMFTAFLGRSKEAVTRSAVAGSALYAAIGLAGLTGAPALETHSAFYHAVALEGLALCLFAFAVSQIPMFWAKEQDTN